MSFKLKHLKCQPTIGWNCRHPWSLNWLWLYNNTKMFLRSLMGYHQYGLITIPSHWFLAALLWKFDLVAILIVQKLRLNKLLLKWYRRVSYNLVQVRSPHPCYLSKRKMKHDIFVPIIGPLMQSLLRILFLCPQWMNYLMNYLEHNISQKWIYILGIIKFLFLRRIATRQLLALTKGCMNG